jgi:hypothetical protein
MPQSSTSILSVQNSEFTEQPKSPNYNWKTWAKASLVFVTTTGAFLALKATGSFSLIYSWLRSSLLETDSNESSALMNPNDSYAQVYTTSISEDMSTSLKGGIDSIQLVNFDESHLTDSVTTDVKSTWLGTWSDNAVTKYIRTLGEESWQCQAGLLLGTAGVWVTGNPLPLGIGALSCLRGADAADPVVVNPILDQAAFIGKQFEFNIPINTFNDTDRDVLSYNVTLADGRSLPEWLKVGNWIIEQPTLLGSLDTDYAWEIAVKDNYAYVADYHSGLKVIDVSNATNPVLAGSIGTNMAVKIAVKDNLAYVADETVGLRIIDTSNLSNLTIIGTCDTYGAYGVAVKDNFVYVADHHAGLKIIDASNPYAPILVGSLDTNGVAYDVMVKDNYAYIADAGAGLKIIDVNNATNPTLVGSLTTSDPSEVVVNENLAYVADTVAGLKIIDVSNPFAPSSTGSISIGTTIGVAVNSNLAYLANAGGGLKIIDVSNPSTPIIVGGLVTYNAYGIAVNGDLVYIADMEEGLKIISVPQMPKLYGIPQEKDLGIINIKIVADDGKGGWVSDIFTLDVQHAPIIANPIPDQTVNVGEMFNFTVPVTTFNDADRDMLSYNIKLADGSPLPEWLKVETISRPSLLNSYNTPGSAYGVAVVNDVAYVADDTGGLRILNVKDPATPSLLGKCGLSCNLVFARGLAVSGNISYVADNNSLRMIDVNDPTKPSYLGSYSTTCNGVGCIWEYCLCGRGQQWTSDRRC